MNNFMRRTLSFRSRNSLLRIAAVAAAGSGLYYANTNSDANTKLLLSFPARPLESLSLPWKLPQNLTPHLSLRLPGQWTLGNLSVSSPRDTPDPAENSGNGDTIKDSRSSPNCLGRDTIANAAAKVGPAVVHLSTQRGHGVTTEKNDGCGTIIDQDGTILTCAHVVAGFQGMQPSTNGMVTVTLQDGRTFLGIVVNADLHSDIAVVKIKSKSPLPVAKLGSSSKLRPGEWVIAVGCPLSLQNTVTAGIVSCVDRKSSDLGLGGMRREYLQTDCSINPGSSGGPLVNMDGEIVGVNIMKFFAADGLAFSVPIDSVSKIIEHFKKNGRVVRPWLGLKMLELNEMISAQLKDRNPLFPDVNKGLFVPMVTPESPGARAGFQAGDVIVEVDGNPVSSITEVNEIMGDRVGHPFKVVIVRSKNAVVTLTVVPEETNPDM